MSNVAHFTGEANTLFTTPSVETLSAPAWQGSKGDRCRRSTCGGSERTDRTRSVESVAAEAWVSAG